MAVNVVRVSVNSSRGYVLVQMVMNDASWHLVRSVPRVMGFIGGTSDRPAPISDKEVDAIMNRLQQVGDKPRPKTLFEPVSWFVLAMVRLQTSTVLLKKWTTKRAA